MQRAESSALCYSAHFCENPPVKISCVIISFNEERKIAGAIESARFADEIVVVDSGSVDRTREIAESLGAKVIVQPWLGFAEQKQFAADKASNDWILSLDADERVSERLRESVLEIRARGPENFQGFRIPRLTTYMERPIRHGGWYPDWQLRLFDRTKGRWSRRRIHESFKLEEGRPVGTLEGDILHLSVDDASHHHRMIGERYAPLAAEQMLADGRRTGAFRVLTAGALAFLQTYFLKLGFLDGLPGFVIARFAAHHAFLKHLMLLEMQNRDSSDATSPDAPTS